MARSKQSARKAQPKYNVATREDAPVAAGKKGKGKRPKKNGQSTRSRKYLAGFDFAANAKALEIQDVGFDFDANAKALEIHNIDPGFAWRKQLSNDVKKTELDRTTNSTSLINGDAGVQSLAAAPEDESLKEFEPPKLVEKLPFKKVVDPNLVPVPPSMRRVGISVRGAPPRRCKGSEESAIDQRHCFGVSDIQTNVFFKNAEDWSNFPVGHPLYSMAVHKGPGILTLSGMFKIWSGVNTVNTRPITKQITYDKNAKDRRLNHYSKYNKKKARTLERFPKVVTCLKKPQWDSLLAHVDASEENYAFIFMNREFVSSQRMGKVNLRKGVPALPTVKGKPTHISVLAIKGRTFKLFDCNNFPFCEDYWIPSFYLMMKRVAVRYVLKKFNLMYKTIDSFDIPVTTYSFGVGNSCSLYCMYAVEMLSKGSAKVDMNKTKAITMLYFEKVAFYVGGHLPYHEFCYRNQDWMTRRDKEWPFEDLLQKIIDGNINMSYANLQLQKKKVLKELQASGKFLNYKDVTTVTTNQVLAMYPDPVNRDEIEEDSCSELSESEDSPSNSSGSDNLEDL